MNLSTPTNAKVLAYLSRGGGTTPEAIPPDAVEDPYYRLGSHPDIVERVWDQLGAAVPKPCRCIAGGTPALVHPQTGIIFALALGTQYGLRLPGGLADEAVRAGAKTQVRWSYGGDLDTRRDLGDEWVFGAWLKQEADWCRKACEVFGSLSAGLACD